MPTTLQEALIDHIEQTGSSVKAVAETSGVSYPTVLAIVRKGGVPRKAGHRESLRQLLGITTEDWGTLLANSARDGLAIPESGPLSLQQLVAKRMYAAGFTEQGFADHIGVPYATISGVIRKNAIPRRDTLAKIADSLDIDAVTLADAITVSRTTRDDEPGGEAVEIPSFTEMLSRYLAEHGQTMGEFAKRNRIGYLTLSRMTTAGKLPDDEAVINTLAGILQVSPNVLRAAISRVASGEAPEASIAMRAHHPIPENASPLQKALIGLMNREGHTIKAMASRCDLSQLTMAKFLKGESVPSRTGTHLKLQKLLGIDRNAYMALVSPVQDIHLQQSNQAMVQHLATAERERHEEDEFEALQEFIDLIRLLTEQQRGALRHFLHSMIEQAD